MHKYFYFPFFFIVSLVFVHCIRTNQTENKADTFESRTIYSSDTLKVYHTVVPPLVNGISSDEAWNMAPWYPINQVWIPYGTEVDSTLFYGRYKILWSEETNLLYILAEITDNVFVGGYKYHSDPQQGQGYANYDILEIFIDENKSGDLHVFNAQGEDAKLWGSNAEAAFAYHIAVAAPDDGETLRTKKALDITGKSWSNYLIADYQDHLPEFALRREGNLYTWEFSLKVFDDTYDHSQPEKSIVKLHQDKVMGFSVAYCNNDDPDEEQKSRDHFFGSVWVPKENYNDHWKDASFFGTIKLVK
jgi:hypothetical protein